MSEETIAMVNTLKNSSSWEDRRDAAKALSSNKDSIVVDALISAFDNDDNSAVYRCAADALGNIGDERAIPHLSQGLHSWVQDKQKHCARALAKFGSKGIDILSTALRSKDMKLRSAVITAIRTTKNPIFIPLLLKALKDPDDWIAADAVYALGEIGDSSITDTLLGVLKRKSSLCFVAAVKQSMSKLGINASDSIAKAERKADKVFLSNLKALKVGMGESKVKKLLREFGTFQIESIVTYKTPYGSFQLHIANGRVIKIPIGFGPALQIKKLEAKLSSKN